MKNDDLVCSFCGKPQHLVKRLIASPDGSCYICDECGLLILDCDVYGDDDHCLCQHCYEEYYVPCECCDRVMYETDSYSHHGRFYCEDCYTEKYERIHN